MAEIVSSAVVEEVVSQILSSLVQKYEEKEESNASRNLERLEMAHIRLEAALETSEKWQIADGSLLRWRRKLKRAAQECDDTLHKCKHRILEKEHMEQKVRNWPLPNRIMHATKSFALSIFNRDNKTLGRSIVQRFEWFADGATEFLRFIEIGGTLRRHMPFDSLIKNLFAGKQLHHKIVRGNEYPLIQLWLIPFSSAEHGTEASLIFIQKGGTPEDNIYFGMIVQLSESTDIVGILIKYLQLFAPHFKCTVENILKELTQLPTQDFSWVPYIHSSKKEHWDNLHNLGSKWFRPNPLCCKQHGRHELQRINNLCMADFSDVSLEPVIEFNLQCQVSLPMYSKLKTSLCEGTLHDSAYLKAGISFAPHGTPEGMLPDNRSSVTVAIAGGDQHCLHTDIALEQLKEIMLPMAIDYFSQNVEATVYQLIWKSKHGSAIIQVEKPTMSIPRKSIRTQRTARVPRKRKLFAEQDQELGNRTHMITHLLNLWGAHVPVRMQRSVIDWMQKEKEIHLAS